MTAPPAALSRNSGGQDLAASLAHGPGARLAPRASPTLPRMTSAIPGLCGRSLGPTRFARCASLDPSTQGTAAVASLDANTGGEGEPGNAAPSATRRTSRTGRPRQTWPAAPLRHLRLAGLPGERAKTAFPLPDIGEGAEGEGPEPSMPATPASARVRAPELRTPDARAGKHTGTGWIRCPLMTATTLKGFAADPEGTREPGNSKAPERRMHRFGPRRRSNHGGPR